MPFGLEKKEAAIQRTSRRHPRPPLAAGRWSGRSSAGRGVEASGWGFLDLERETNKKRKLVLGPAPLF